jgi:hypothetical protein
MIKKDDRLNNINIDNNKEEDEMRDYCVSCFGYLIDEYGK